jgi:hypothetical protein
MKTPTRLRPLRAVLLLASLAALGGCTAQAYCDRVAECRQDAPGEDFVEICKITYDGQIRALRANKEDVCHILADAKLAFDSCMAAQDCEDFRATPGCSDDDRRDIPRDCRDPWDDFCDALRDTRPDPTRASECGTAD